VAAEATAYQDEKKSESLSIHQSSHYLFIL